MRKEEEEALGGKIWEKEKGGGGERGCGGRRNEKD